MLPVIICKLVMICMISAFEMVLYKAVWMQYVTLELLYSIRHCVANSGITQSEPWIPV